MKVIEKIEKIENQIEELQKDLEKYKKIQARIDEIDSQIMKIGNEMYGKQHLEILDKIELRDKLHDDILDIEWNAKTNEERLDSRRHNITYFRKLDYPNFKQEDYAYEYAIISYTESLFSIILVIEKIRGINKRQKLLRIKDWLYQELDGLLYSRKDIVLQDYSDFIEWINLLKTKKPYWDLEELEKECIEDYLKKLVTIHTFKNKEVKFWY